MGLLCGIGGIAGCCYAAGEMDPKKICGKLCGTGGLRDGTNSKLHPLWTVHRKMRLSAEISDGSAGIQPPSGIGLPLLPLRRMYPCLPEEDQRQRSSTCSAPGAGGEQRRQDPGKGLRRPDCRKEGLLVP